MNNDSQNTIELLKPVALAVGRHIQDWHDGRNQSDALWFRGDNWDRHNIIAAAWVGDGVIEYRLNAHADIRITNIDIPAIDRDNIFVGPIEPAGPQQVVRAHVMATQNQLDTDIDREVVFKDITQDIDNVANEVGASISLGLRQQLSYGGELYGISGETEITANISAEYKRAWDTSRSRGFEIESKRNFVEKARARTIFDRVETVGPARQVIRARGQLTFGVRIHSSGHWVHEWPNLRSMLANLQGIDDGHAWGMALYQPYPVPNAAALPIFAPVYAEVERVREFQDSTSITVDIRNEPL